MYYYPTEKGTITSYSVVACKVNFQSQPVVKINIPQNHDGVIHNHLVMSAVSNATQIQGTEYIAIQLQYGFYQLVFTLARESLLDFNTKNNT